MGGENDLGAVFIYLLIFEQHYDVSENHGMKLRVKLVYYKQVSVSQRTANIRHDIKQFLCTVGLFKRCELIDIIVYDMVEVNFYIV